MDERDRALRQRSGKQSLRSRRSGSRCGLLRHAPICELDLGPTRVRPRTVLDWAIGYTKTRGDGRRIWEAVATINNMANTTALYNFQSIFVGTRVVAPRNAGFRFRYYF